jgi:hypothetical protein
MKIPMSTNVGENTSMKMVSNLCAVKLIITNLQTTYQYLQTIDMIENIILVLNF